MARYARGRFPSLTRRFVATPTVITIVVLSAPVAEAGPRWMLIHYRQIGNVLNQDSRTIENHVFNEDGTKALGVGFTNQYNPGSAIFGYSDINGWCRIEPLDPNNCTYDITIYDPSTPKDQTPVFSWQNRFDGWPDFYSYVTQWLYVSEESAVNADPENPVYHYDLVDGLNYADGFGPDCEPYGWVEAPGANSDACELPPGGWSAYQAQTFVVPPNVNRIISAQSYLSRGAGDPAFDYWASIHEGSPTGPQIGPTVTWEQHHSVNFKEEAVCWGIDDVPVTPGQTYALKLEPTDGGGCNVWRTTADNYPNGCVYHGTTQVPGSDMVAVVVGVTYDTTPPTIERNPASFAHTVIKGRNLANDTFSLANSGGGLMAYTISDDASWLYADPDSGSVRTGADTIAIVYSTAGLASGFHSAAITIEAPGATNTPQSVTVELTIPKPADFDRDGDVDQEDFGKFQACYSGSVTQDDPLCEAALLDPDNDVDQHDFTRFQACLSGPGVPSDPTCADPPP